MSKAVPNNSALTAKERALVFHQIERTLSIETPNDFLNWARAELKTIFPYEILICGTGQINARNIHIKKYLCDGFPMEYVEAIRHSDQGEVLRPVRDGQLP